MKESEIVAMQEQLYAMNSKENVRILRDSETQERVARMEAEKRQLLREVAELRARWN